VRVSSSALAILALVLASSSAAQSRDLADMSGPQIKALQQRLVNAGCFRGAVDGQANAALQAAISACPSQDPILRIETGMHVSTIWRIGVDRACRIAATGSADKTVRVWSLPDGHLLRTLRVPIGSGNAGMIFATAVSPDGRWIAAAGFDAQAEITHQAYVYIFDTASGAVAARAGPFANVIHGLAFSPDGRWLAATSAAGVGIKVIDVQTWRIVAEDQAYRGDAYAAAFAADGHLYTLAWDGKLRQYGPGPAFKKEREVATRGGRHPTTIAVDPRGELLAVGFAESTKIDLYDRATLRLRFAADAAGLLVGDLGAVAWSKDGAHLFAGGEYKIPYHDSSKFPLMTFDRLGKPAAAPLPVADDSIHSLQPCADMIAVASADAAFGLVGDDGQIRLWVTGVAPDMRGKHDTDAFTIAPDAKQVRFGLGYGEDDPVLVDLRQATLASAPNLLPGMIAPLTEGLPVAGWKDEEIPTFDGKRLAIEQDTDSRSLAIRGDRTGFVLGTDFSLHAFDGRGREVWRQTGPDVAWGVNFSADGRVVVVAYGDGTIRWRRWSDGQELLALFVNRESKAWVAWTPTGYYVASPGGEDLIGWHLNRGWDQAADFFSASRFRERFNRPDIVRLVLDTLDEDAAVKQANEIARRREDKEPLIGHLPPVIRIADPATGTHVSADTVTLDYAVRSPSGQPVSRIDILIDGRPVKALGVPILHVAADTETTGSISVTLTQRLTEVGLIAWSGDFASEAVRIGLSWDGAPEATRKLHALVVGVSNYADPTMAIQYAAKDARDFAKALQDQKGRYYADVETRVLTDRDVTRASIIEGLEWLEKNATNPNDVSVLFLAGHAMTDNKQAYWFYSSDSNDDTVRVNGVSQEDLRKSLQDLPGKVLWFLDTCHAAAAAKRSPVDINVLVNTVSASENGGIVVFASSSGRQVSVENSTLGNGAFTKALVEGIELGKADLLGKGFVTTSSLDTFVENRVQQLTDGKQNPVMERPPEEPDFTIAEVKKQ
jgi:WD40 repeat protein